MATQTVQDILNDVESAKSLLAQTQKSFDFNAEHVAAAVSMLSLHVPKQPKAPAFWLVLADAQMMQGKLSASKHSFAHALSIMYPHGFAIHPDHGGRRRNKCTAKSGSPDPFSVMGAPYTRSNFDKVLGSYRSMAALGMRDRRLCFYIFNMLKAVDDMASAYAWLDCEDIDDTFFSLYVR